MLEKLTPMRYIRQSSDERSGKQSASFPKQYNATDDILEEYFLDIDVPNKEEDISAKDPYKKPRPEWKEIVQMIVDGLVNCLVCWKLSRLARNEMEAAEIMMLYRRGKILAIFTAEKVYYKHTAREYDDMQEEFHKAISHSDYLSEDITDGNDTILKDGLSNGKFKWGYYRKDADEGGKYIPCKYNFDIIKEALEMMIAGAKNLEVLEFLQEKECRRVYKKKQENGSHKESLPSLQTVANIRKDPIYYGVLMQSNKAIDLCTLRGYGFEPMITEDEYKLIQGQGNVKGKSVRTNMRYKRKGIKKPFDGLLKCTCGAHCMIDISRGKQGTYYAYARCVKKQKCPAFIQAKAEGTSVKFTRLKVIMDAMQLELQDRTMNHDVNEKLLLEGFQQETKEYLETEAKVMKSDRKNLRRKKSEIEQCLEDHIKSGISFGKMDVREKETYDKLKDQMLVDIQKIDQQIKALEDGSTLYSFDYSRTVKLLEHGFSNFRDAHPTDIDHFSRILWSNLTVFNGEVQNFAWNPVIENLFYPVLTNGGAVVSDTNQYRDFWSPLECLS